MTAAAITSDILCKNECPIQGHTFLPNNKNGIMLFHIMMMSMKTAWKWESVNLSSMEKRKVSTFLANEEKKRLLSYTAIGRHIYKRLKMCKQYAKEMATLQ